MVARIFQRGGGGGGQIVEGREGSEISECVYQNGCHCGKGYDTFLLSDQQGVMAPCAPLSYVSDEIKYIVCHLFDLKLAW